MNGPSYPSGCPGALWSSGQPSQSYCQGTEGKYLWWSSCCQWEAGSCQPKPTTTTTGSFQAPLYAAGGTNTLTCPHGYSGILSDTDCTAAAQTLELVWRSTENAPMWPGGCYKVSNHVYYNHADPGQAKSFGNIICRLENIEAGGRRLVVSKSLHANNATSSSMGQVLV
jgi:hypothetical protein